MLEQESGSKQPLGQISGFVVRSDNGAPIAKASVSLYPQDEPTTKAAGGTRVTRTGADGSFVFTGVPAGAYAIVAWRNGFARSRIMWEPLRAPISLRAGQQLDHLKLFLTPAGVISGKLTDEDLDPVVGVNVEVIRVEYLPGGRRQIYLTARALSDDQGNFRIAELPPGSYFVRAGGFIQQPLLQIALKNGAGSASLYRQTYFPGTPTFDDAQPVDVRPEAETANIRIQLAPEKVFSISGTVIGSPSSAKLKPTEITIEKRDAVYPMWNDRGNSLIENGSFTAHWFSPGEYTLTAAAIEPDNDGKAAHEVDEGFASVRIMDSDVRVEVQLGRSAEIRGTVEAPAGFPFAKKQIILQTRNMAYYPSDLDDKGRFGVVHFPPGEYTISIKDKRSPLQSSYVKQADCSGRDFATQPIELSLDVVVNCTLIVADDVGAVSGQATYGDSPAAGLVVVLIPQLRTLRRMPRYTLSAKTDSAGRYTIAGVIPGDYFVFAVPPSDAREYFALDFAERNEAHAVRATISPRSTQTVNLSVTPAK